MKSFLVLDYYLTTKAVRGQNKLHTISDDKCG